jgi:hypothetical protein
MTGEQDYEVKQAMKIGNTQTVTVNVPDMHKKIQYIIENAENIIYIANNLMHLQEFRAELQAYAELILKTVKGWEL